MITPSLIISRSHLKMLRNQQGSQFPFSRFISAPLHIASIYIHLIITTFRISLAATSDLFAMPGQHSASSYMSPNARSAFPARADGSQDFRISCIQLQRYVQTTRSASRIYQTLSQYNCWPLSIGIRSKSFWNHSLSRNRAFSSFSTSVGNGDQERRTRSVRFSEGRIVREAARLEAPVGTLVGRDYGERARCQRLSEECVFREAAPIEALVAQSMEKVWKST